MVSYDTEVVKFSVWKVRVSERYGLIGCMLKIFVFISKWKCLTLESLGYDRFSCVPLWFRSISAGKFLPF